MLISSFSNILEKNNMISESYTSETNNEILNEQYFGKNSNLKKIDQCFDELIKISKQNANGKVVKYTDQNKEKKFYTQAKTALLKIGDILEDEFNLKIASINTINIGMANALTINRTDKNQKIKDLQNNVIVTNNGFRFKKKSESFTIFMTRELFDLDGIEGKHLTAILLHEIGHRFYYENTIRYRLSLSMYIDEICNLMVLNPIYVIQNLGRIVLGTQIVAPIMSQIITEPIAQASKQMTKMDDGSFKYVLGVYNTFKTITHEMNYMMMKLRIITNGNVVLRHPVVNVRKAAKIIFGDEDYNEEQFSDAFATSYGYGKEFIEGIEMISSQSGTQFSRTMYSNAATGLIWNGLTDLDYMLFGSADCHPNSIARIVDQIKYIELQLENDKNNPLYQDMKNDLEEMRKSYEKVKDKTAKINKNSDAITKGKIFTTIGNAIKVAMGGGVQYNMTKKVYDKQGNLNVVNDLNKNKK